MVKNKPLKGTSSISYLHKKALATALNNPAEAKDSLCITAY